MIASILSAISAIWGLVKLGLALIKQIGDWLARRKVEKKDEDLREKLDEAEKAKTLQEKADAACEIEKMLNPNSNCDKPPGS